MVIISIHNGFAVNRKTICCELGPLPYQKSYLTPCDLTFFSKQRVEPLVVVDNSAFSPGRLTALLTLPILASKGRSPSFPFQPARILMALHLFVFVLLLVVCLLLLLARLGRLDWFPLQPFSSQGAAKRSRLPRLLKPRSPDDCPYAGYLSYPPAQSGL